MTISRDTRLAPAPPVASSHRERGQSSTEYILILAVVAAASIAVLAMMNPALSGQLDSVTTALGGESEGSGVAVPGGLPSLIVIGALIIGGVGLYVLRMRRG